MTAVSQTSKFKVVLLEEGLGNFGSAVYYTRQAIQSASDDKVFEGKKCFADHPSKIEEQVLPERSVKAIEGYFQNVHPEPGDKGQLLLVGDLCILDGQSHDWSRTLLKEAVNFSGKFNRDLIGLSINANGDTNSAQLESFISGATIPESALPKLKEALAKGISEIQICTRITEAVSCDLVTEAGAKGRVLQLLEQEKTRMSENEKKEAEAKAAKEAEDKKQADEKAAKEKKEGDDHADEDQDKKLIKDMLKKYLGDGDHGEEVEAKAHEAHQLAKEMGMEGEEALKCAGYSMKMAKHAAEKAAKQKKEGEGDAPPSAKKNDDADDDDKDAKAKESEIIRLKGENASLLEKVKKFELDAFLDKTLKESGLPMSVTKKFRECVGSVKTEKEVSEKLTLFKEAYQVGGGEAGGLGGIIINPEKTECVAGGLSFADCVSE